MLATLMFGLNGTIFLYQGEELGLPNPYFTDLSVYNDVDSITQYKDLVLKNKVISHDKFMNGLLKNSRDNARCPMQWDNSINSGFNKGQKTWLNMNEKYKHINVENEMNDCNSVLSYYMKLIKLRKSEYKDVLINGKFERLDKFEVNEDMFVYKKISNNKTIIVIINLGDNEIYYDNNLIANKKVIISNYDKHDNILKPYEAMILEV